MTIYANNVAGVLALAVGPSDGQLILSAGQGAAFPAPGTDYYWATLVHPTTFAVEIVRVTAKSSDTLTVTRGRDGTTAIAFPVGTIVEMRLTAEMLREVNYRAAINAINGVAGLDASAKILTAQLPASVPLMTDGVLPMSVIPNGVTTDTELASAVSSLQTSIAAKVSKARDTMSGTLGIKAGPFGVQQGLLAFGWNNGVTRWFWIMESDGSLGLYSYDASGASPAQAMRFSGASAGGGNALNIGGFTAWHAGNFNPSSKANTLAPSLTNPRVFRDGFGGGQGLIYWGGNGPYQLFDGANFSFSHNVYAPNLIGTSDVTMKKSIRRVKPVRGIGDLIELISWEWRRSKMPDAPKGRHYGVSAQKVKEFAPHHVHVGPSGKLGVDKAGLALEAAVDNARRIRELEAEVAGLKETVSQLLKKPR